MEEDDIKPFGHILKCQLLLLSSQVFFFKTRCYYKFARHILRKHMMDFWYFEDDYHVSQHAFEAAQPEECCSTVSAKRIEINATKMQKRRPMSEMPGLLSGGLTILMC